MPARPKPAIIYVLIALASYWRQPSIGPQLTWRARSIAQIPICAKDVRMGLLALMSVPAVAEGEDDRDAEYVNKKGGGMYAMERTAKHVKMWFWPRGKEG